MLSQQYRLIYVLTADENTQRRTRERGKVQWLRVGLVRFVERNIALRRFIIAREGREMVFTLFISARKRRYPRINSRAMALKCEFSPPEGKICETCLYRAIPRCQIFICCALSFQRIRALYRNVDKRISIGARARERERERERGC